MTVNTRCNDCSTMHRTRYSPERKAEALQLFARLGQAEAARLTGIPQGTIASWAARTGVKGPESNEMVLSATRKATAVKRVAFAERRADLANQLGEVAELAAAKLRQMLDDDRCTAGDIARALAVVIDRAQLLSGGATVRTETVERTPEAEAEVARVLQLVRAA